MGGAACTSAQSVSRMPFTKRALCTSRASRCVYARRTLGSTMMRLNPRRWKSLHSRVHSEAAHSPFSCPLGCSSECQH